MVVWLRAKVVVRVEGGFVVAILKVRVMLSEGEDGVKVGMRVTKDEDEGVDDGEGDDEGE